MTEEVLEQEQVKEGKLVKSEENQIDINALIPLGVELIANSQKQSETQAELQRERLKIEEKRLAIYKSAFSHKYWLMVLIAVSVLGISVGLIFIKNDTASGISMLSHIGAVVVGIIAGSGWERIRTR